MESPFYVIFLAHLLLQAELSISVLWLDFT